MVTRGQGDKGRGIRIDAEAERQGYYVRGHGDKGRERGSRGDKLASGQGDKGEMLIKYRDTPGQNTGAKIEGGVGPSGI